MEQQGTLTATTEYVVPRSMPTEPVLPALAFWTLFEHGRGRPGLWFHGTLTHSRAAGACFIRWQPSALASVLCNYHFSGPIEDRSRIETTSGPTDTQLGPACADFSAVKRGAGQEPAHGAVWAQIQRLPTADMALIRSKYTPR